MRDRFRKADRCPKWSSKRTNREADGLAKKPKRRIRAFIQLGLPRFRARQYGYSRMSGWAIACSPIMGTTVTEARLRVKGYIPFLEYYHQIRTALNRK